MAPGLPRTSFNSSTLVRLLTEFQIAEAAIIGNRGNIGNSVGNSVGNAVGNAAPATDSKQSFAERLGLWLGWADAISLSSALSLSPAPKPAAGRAAAATTGSGTPSSASSPAPAQAPAQAIIEEFARLRSDLTRSISVDAALAAESPQTRLPARTGGEATVPVSDFSAHRRRYLAHQRAMEASISALRGNVRAVLSGMSPALQRIAALDAVFDAALLARERHLLSKLPSWLEKRFERLRLTQTQTQTPDPLPSIAAPDPSQPPPAWLAVVGQDMQALLLAELQLRLQPVDAMMEAMTEAMNHETALGHETTRDHEAASRS